MRSIKNQHEGTRPPLGTMLAAVVLVSIFGAANPTQAQLVELDFALPGDGWVTRDTINGLDWIDLTVTNGWSVDDALASGYVTFFGYHVATAAEVDLLFETAGVSSSRFTVTQSAEESIGHTSGIPPFAISPPTVPTSEALTAFQTLGPLLGFTSQLTFAGVTNQVINGYFSDDPSIDWVGLSNNRRMATPRGSGWILKYNVDQPGVDSDTSNTGTGVFLVRASQDPPGC